MGAGAYSAAPIGSMRALPCPAGATDLHNVTQVLNPASGVADSTPMPTESPDTLRKAVEMHLDRLRPAMIADGGNVELVDIDVDGTVRIEFQGECASCPAQLATLRIGLEAPLCEAIPGVTAVVPI